MARVSVIGAGADVPFEPLTDGWVALVADRGSRADALCVKGQGALATQGTEPSCDAASLRFLHSARRSASTARLRRWSVPAWELINDVRLSSMRVSETQTSRRRAFVGTRASDLPRCLNRSGWRTARGGPLSGAC